MTAIEAYLLANAFVGIIFAVAVLLAIIWLFDYIRKTKSQHYRSYLSDLYIAAKVRQWADVDKVDLEKEGDRFMVWAKKFRERRIKEIDRKIEEEVNARIDKEIDRVDETFQKNEK